MYLFQLNFVLTYYVTFSFSLNSCYFDNYVGHELFMQTMTKSAKNDNLAVGEDFKSPRPKNQELLMITKKKKKGKKSVKMEIVRFEQPLEFWG